MHESFVRDLHDEICATISQTNNKPAKISQPHQLNEKQSLILLQEVKGYIETNQSLDFVEIRKVLKNKDQKNFGWLNPSDNRHIIKLSNEQKRTRERQRQETPVDKRDELMLEIIKLKANITKSSESSLKLEEDGEKMKTGKKGKKIKRGLIIQRLTDTSKELTDATKRMERSIASDEKRLNALLQLEAIKFRVKFPQAKAGVDQLLITKFN